jgi:pimeloyl-ACP methyl ester carboxylesterase
MLHYEISGTGTEDLAILHGFMENLTIWSDLEKYLSKKFRLIKIDLPGHGKSENYAETHTMELMAEKVKEVANHLNLQKFHLLGHSMGGYVSLAFAEKFAENLKSLTLFFSTYFPDDDEKKKQRQQSLSIIPENFKIFVNMGIPNLFGENEKDVMEEKIKFAKEIALSTKIEGVLAAVKGMMERSDKKNVIENLNAKILIIAGKHDNAVKIEPMLKTLPDKTNIKTYILDCGHNGHWEKPSICAEIINVELLHSIFGNY